mmetsp:Transcript_24683/g.75254  ORF Transcript_24683/g.75254 Transcript_24683/m.75254 type:complete len:254 (+) Transcript_24683:40-801(+)
MLRAAIRRALSSQTSQYGRAFVLSDEAYLEMAILTGLCLVALCVGQFLHRRHLHWLPESGATIIIGFVFALIEDQSDSGRIEEQVQRKRYFDPIFFNLFLLPPIIFESGFHLNLSVFFDNLHTITLLAVIGTLLATGFTWVVIYYAGQLGWTAVALPIREAGAFAALISAVDPVATLATFGTLRVDHTLHTIVFGESVKSSKSLLCFSSGLEYSCRCQRWSQSSNINPPLCLGVGPTSQRGCRSRPCLHQFHC